MLAPVLQVLLDLTPNLPQCTRTVQRCPLAPRAHFDRVELIFDFFNQEIQRRLNTPAQPIGATSPGCLPGIGPNTPRFGDAPRTARGY